METIFLVNFSEIGDAHEEFFGAFKTFEGALEAIEGEIEANGWETDDKCVTRLVKIEAWKSLYQLEVGEIGGDNDFFTDSIFEIRETELK